jgi:putative SOS response-associated peptidase YedK
MLVSPASVCDRRRWHTAGGQLTDREKGQKGKSAEKESCRSGQEMTSSTGQMGQNLAVLEGPGDYKRTKDPAIGNRMINARAEGIAAKNAYKRALVRRRCIIPADAFYE